MASDYSDKRLRDRIEPGVRVLFVGINPGVRSALTGHHFAGFSNRFWRLLYESRLVPEPVTYEDDDRLPDWGFGITNVVPRATPGIDTLRPEEYRDGTRTLLRKVNRYRPAVLALIGVTVWRAVLEGTGAPGGKDATDYVGPAETRGAGPERRPTHSRDDAHLRPAKSERTECELFVCGDAGGVQEVETSTLTVRSATFGVRSPFGVRSATCVRSAKFGMRSAKFSRRGGR